MSTTPEAVTPRDAAPVADPTTENATTQKPTTEYPTGERATDTRAAAGSGWAVLRPLVLRLHFYAGVLVAPFLAIACLTGIVYVFSPQLSDLVYSHELLVGPHAGAQRPLDEQVAAAVAAHPEGTLNSLVVDSDPGRTTGVVLDVDGLPEDTQRSVYVDPYTADVRGSLDTWFDTPPLQTTLDALHRNLLLGEPGRLYSELAASWLWVVVLGGLALWIGKRRGRRTAAAALLPPRRMRPGRRRIMGWHGATGVWLTVALLFLSATGLTWSNYAGGRFSTFVDAVKSSTPTLAAEPVPLRDAPLITVQDAVDRARAGGLEGPLKVTLPAEPGTPFTVAEIARDWPVQRDEVALDPYTGAVTEAIVWSDFPVLAKLTRIGILAHMGSLFGLVSQLALVAAALGLLSLIFWGYRMWWQRRPTRSAFRLTPPVRRGTLRAEVEQVVADLTYWQRLGVTVLAIDPLPRGARIVVAHLHPLVARAMRARYRFPVECWEAPTVGTGPDIAAARAES